MNAAEQAIRSEIQRRERELEALKKALAALTGTAVSKGRSKRRAMSAAQKKALSAKMKAIWKKRKGAEKKG